MEIHSVYSIPKEQLVDQLEIALIYLMEANELLKKYEKNKKVCMFCNTRYHTDDCELAKHLESIDG